jgi:hypothetical protein
LEKLVGCLVQQQTARMEAGEFIEQISSTWTAIRLSKSFVRNDLLKPN